MMRLIPLSKKRFTGFLVLALTLFAATNSALGQVFTISTSASVTGFNSHVLESMTGWTGTVTPTTGVTSWDLRGTGTGGSVGRGTDLAGGTAGGWYGNGNIAFLGAIFFTAFTIFFATPIC